MSWAFTILGIMLLVVLHELGHFTVAKAVGMRVERFSLFFGPMLVKVKRGETTYGIGPIPLGGYVKITGMNPEELEDLDPEATRRAYYSQPPWKRIAVILAGPGVNIAIAFVLFWAILLSGSVHGAITLNNLDPSAETLVPTTAVREVRPGTAAAGTLRVGDRIVAVNGQPARSVQSIRDVIGSDRCVGTQTPGCRAPRPVALTVRRDGGLRTLSIYPRYDKETGSMLIGFGFGIEAKQLGPVAAAGTAISTMWHVTTQTITNLGRALTEPKVRHQVSSIVGITQVGHETVVAGASYALVFLGFVSLILAVINLFPFLPLDGGHVAWSLAEKLRGRRVSLLAMYRYSSVGIVLMLFLFINGVSNDISRLAG